MDLELGFHEIAENYYFPGWHQPASLRELMINLDYGNSLILTKKHKLKSHVEKCF